MTDKLAITTPSALQPADAASADLAAILRAAQNPTTNIDTVERLLTMHRDLMKDQARTSYRAAMARLQGRLPQIAKSGTIDHGPGKMKNRFARLEDIDQAIRPICAEEGFAFSYDSKPGPTGITYSCEMSHKDGHAEVKTLTLPVDNSGAKNPVQAVGSSTSYARRYLLEMHLHLIKRDEDDDGNGGSRPVAPEQADALRAGLAAAGGNEGRFLKWLHATSFETVLEKDYGRAMRFIGEKKGAVSK